MVLTMNSNTERAFLRARELLRRESALTELDLGELHELFDQVNGTQFMALTQDPQHARALREYDRYTSQPARRIVMILVGLFVFSVVMGFYVN